MLNADQNELDKFSQLAHRWWDPHSEFKPLHQINPLRLAWIDSLANIPGREYWILAAAVESCRRAWP